MRPNPVNPSCRLPIQKRVIVFVQLMIVLMHEENTTGTILIVWALLGVKGLQRVHGVLLTPTDSGPLTGEKQNIETMISQRSGMMWEILTGVRAFHPGMKIIVEGRMHTFVGILDITHGKMHISPGMVGGVAAAAAILPGRTFIHPEKERVCSEILSIHPGILCMHREKRPILSETLAISLVVAVICHGMTLTQAGITDTCVRKSMYSETQGTSNGIRVILKENHLPTGREKPHTPKEIEHTRRETALTPTEVVAIKKETGPILKEPTLNATGEGELKTTAEKEPSERVTKTGTGIITANLILIEKGGGMTGTMIGENDSR